MSMVTELFGEKALTWSLETIKEKVRSLPPSWSERLSYILHDWSRLTGIKLTHQDFIDVGALSQTK